MSKHKIIVVLVLLVIFIGVVLAINSSNVRDFFSILDAKTSTNRSTFNTMLDKQLSPDIEEQFKNDPDGKLVYEVGWGVKKVPDTAMWDYKTVPVLADITAVNKDRHSLTVTFNKPISLPVLGITKELTLNDCNENNTYITDGTNTFVNRNFWDDVKPGDQLTTFCTNSDCTKIGRLCKARIHPPESPFED